MITIFVTYRGERTEITDFMYWFEENHIDSIRDENVFVEIYLDEKLIWTTTKEKK